MADLWLVCTRGCDITPTAAPAEVDEQKAYHERQNPGHKVLVQPIGKVVMDADDVAEARYLDQIYGRGR